SMTKSRCLLAVCVVGVAAGAMLAAPAPEEYVSHLKAADVMGSWHLAIGKTALPEKRLPELKISSDRTCSFTTERHTAWTGKRYVGGWTFAKDTLEVRAVESAEERIDKEKVVADPKAKEFKFVFQPQEKGHELKHLRGQLTEGK